jgi:hypothetical protein
MSIGLHQSSVPSRCLKTSCRSRRTPKSSSFCFAYPIGMRWQNYGCIATLRLYYWMRKQVISGGGFDILGMISVRNLRHMNFVGRQTLDKKLRSRMAAAMLPAQRGQKGSISTHTRSIASVITLTLSGEVVQRIHTPPNQLSSFTSQLGWNG